MQVFVIQTLLCLIFLKPIYSKNVLEDYLKTRNELLDRESLNTLGGQISLDNEEKQANYILMKFKEAQLARSFIDPGNFSLSKHYFQHRDQIERSEVYQIIKRMPKGAALHIHSTLMLGPDELLRLAYEEMDYLYTCLTNNNIKIQFSRYTPKSYCRNKWKLLKHLRASSKNVHKFDSNLKKHFTIFNSKDTQDDINTIWKKFNNVFYTIKDLITYRPIREKFIYNSLKKFYDDNVMYVEIRSGAQSLYELDGFVHDGSYMAKLYKNVTERFKKDHPDFVGIKWIYTVPRTVSIDQLKVHLNSARRYKKEFPDLFAGFDLVGQEDKGKPLREFLPALLEVKGHINFYFHGGETNWYGSTTDENLFDVFLLGSKRIGHAYSLLRHPSLMADVHTYKIPIEVNVISNAVLGLVSDVRNHPLASYLALDLPVVLSSDDPGVWGAEPLSHDFYVAFVAVASRNADLRLLKQLAINSIKYSALSDDGKKELFQVFNRRWDWFVKDIKATYSSYLHTN